jgi:hypothetical protein
MTMWGKEKPTVHPNCHLYFSGALNSNLLSSYKGILSYFINSMEEWKTVRYSWNATLDFLRKKEISFLYNIYQPMLTTYYYGMISDQANGIVDQLSQDLELAEMARYTMILFLVICTLTMYLCVVRRVAELMNRATMVMEVICYKILEENIVIKCHLKKVNNGAHLYKI